VILHYNDIDIKAIAFLIPNTKSAKELSKFVCSVDHIEELTGIDFFPELPDSIESVVERQSRTNQWIWN
jgi:endonuclease G